MFVYMGVDEWVAQMVIRVYEDSDQAVAGTLIQSSSSSFVS